MSPRYYTETNEQIKKDAISIPFTFSDLLPEILN